MEQNRSESKKHREASIQKTEEQKFETVKNFRIYTDYVFACMIW